MVHVRGETLKIKEFINTVARHYHFIFTVNQILFAATLFRGLLSIKWFANTNVRAQALSRAVLLYQPFDKIH